KKVLEYFYSVMQSLIRILEARDPYTKGHSERVSEYAVSIARKMGLPQDKIDILREGALLHDIGKLGVKEVILNKKVKLTDEERGIIMKHPVIGENILKPVAINKEVLDVVREHHERYDGKGYPDKLDGEHIDMLAAIVSAADSYDAMTSDRGYEKNLTKEEGIEQLRANSGSQFNPKIVDAFIQVLQEK
ncbi:MAG: HD-GYP domain-containing protein, partial [Candidatus Omnitrophica bacterium]|nr:HD-GYP domain-containing protein [Candidatus Omnitrophota bacterium]